MTTANIIMAIFLIVLMGAAVIIILRYLRKSSELSHEMEVIAQATSNLQLRKNELDLREKQINANAGKEMKPIVTRIHTDGTMKKSKLRKAFASKMGYGIVDLCQFHEEKCETGGVDYYTIINVIGDKK